MVPKCLVTMANSSRGDCGSLMYEEVGAVINLRAIDLPLLPPLVFLTIVISELDKYMRWG